MAFTSAFRTLSRDIRSILGFRILKPVEGCGLHARPAAAREAVDADVAWGLHA